MSRLFFGNFEFESRLTTTGGALSARVQRLNAELACCWLAIAAPDDCIVCPASFSTADRAFLSDHGIAAPQTVSRLDQTRPDLELVPWGWTAELIAGRPPTSPGFPPPAAGVIRNANSRRFSFACEQAENCGLAGASAAGSLEEAQAAIAAIASREGRWVIKAEFSHSARERILGDGRALSEPHRAWCLKRLSRDHVLFVEPWVERVDEAGFQWTIPHRGAPHLDGIAPLLCDAGGQYQGSVFAPTVEDLLPWESAVEATERVVCRLQQAGYFGPVGIDAMRYRDATGGVRLRPVQDVNARWTMGRLSLGWRRLIAAGDRGQWRHGSPDDRPQGSVAMRIIPTSPGELGGQPVKHVTWLELTRLAPREGAAADAGG